MAKPSTRANVILTLVDKTTPALRKVSQNLNKMAVSSKRAGMAMGAGAIGMGLILKHTIGAYEKLDTNMKLVAARAQEITPTQLEALTEQAKLLGRTTTFTAGEVSALMAKLAQGGLGAGEINASTAALLNFAKAASISTEQAAEFAVGTTKAFGLSVTTESIAHTADVLTFAANNSMQSVEELGYAMQDSSAVANEMGQSMETVASTIAVMANSNIKGSKSGRILKNVLLSMASKGGELAEVLGVDLVDGTGNIKNLAQIMGEFDARTQNMGALQKMNMLNEAFGKLGIAGTLIGGKGASGILNMAKGMNKLNGYTQKTADIMNSGVRGALEQMKSALEGINIAIGEQLAPLLKGVAPMLAKWMNNLTPFIEGIKGLGLYLSTTFLSLAGGAAALLGFAGVATVLATIVSGVAGLIGIVGSVITAVTTVGTVIAGWPLIAVGAAIAGVGYAVYEVLDGLERLTVGWNAFTGVVEEFSGAIMDALELGKVEEAYQLMMDTIVLATREGLEEASGLFGEYIKWVTGNAVGILRLAESTVVHGGTTGIGFIGAAAAGMTVDKEIYNEWSRARQKTWDEMKAARKAYDEDTTENARASLEKRKRLLQAEVAYERQVAADKKKAALATAAGGKGNFGGAVDPKRNFETVEERDKRISKERKAREAAKAKAVRDAAKAKKAADALLEEVTFSRTKSMGAIGGSTVAGVSANLGKSILQVAQDQLTETKKHTRMMEKDRANKGKLWV